MSVQTTVDSLKRQALKEILKNVSIPSVYVLSKLNKYISTGSLSVFSMAALVNINAFKPTSGDINAKILFSYLEVYTSYVLGFTSTQMFNELSSLTTSKYEYVIRKYKEVMSQLRSKSLEKEFRWNMYVDFSVPNNIFFKAFNSNVFDVASMSKLSYNDVLSLPVISTETIIPDETSAHIEDSTISKLEQETSRNYLYCKLFRMVGERIGRVFGANSIQAWGDSNGILPRPLIAGSTSGYVCDSFSLQISKIIDDRVFYRTSLDGVNWFEETESLVGVYEENNIFLDGGLDTGLKFKFLPNHQANVGSTWTISISYYTLSDPICKIKSVFNTIYHMSYIKFNDVSLHKLDIKSNPVIKDTETSEGSIEVQIVNRDISQLIPVNSTVYSIELPVVQSKSSITSKDDKLAYLYDFNLVDIQAVRNKYSNYGVVMFNPLTVKDISTVSVKADSNIKRYKNPDFVPRWPNSTTNPLLDDHFNEYKVDKAFILYSVVCETDYGICDIPILQEDFYDKFPDLYDSQNNEYYVNDPVISFDAISTSNLTDKVYKLRYPRVKGFDKIVSLWDLTRDPSAFSQNPNPVTSALLSGTAHDSFVGYTVKVNTFYSLNYPVKIMKQYDTLIGVVFETDNYADSKWTVVNSAKVAYMLYKDIEGKVQLAIRSISQKDRSNNTLIPFTGLIYGKITMHSSDLDYISPYVFNYSISCS